MMKNLEATYTDVYSDELINVISSEEQVNMSHEQIVSRNKMIDRKRGVYMGY